MALGVKNLLNRVNNTPNLWTEYPGDDNPIEDPGISV
jgi:hypothetical protein